MFKCGHCGKPIRLTDKICPFCKKQIQVNPQNASAAKPFEVIEIHQSKTPSFESSKKTMIGIPSIDFLMGESKTKEKEVSPGNEPNFEHTKTIYGIPAIDINETDPLAEPMEKTSQIRESQTQSPSDLSIENDITGEMFIQQSIENKEKTIIGMPAIPPAAVQKKTDSFHSITFKKPQPQMEPASGSSATVLKTTQTFFDFNKGEPPAINNASSASQSPGAWQPAYESAAAAGIEIKKTIEDLAADDFNPNQDLEPQLSNPQLFLSKTLEEDKNQFIAKHSEPSVYPAAPYPGHESGPWISQEAPFEWTAPQDPSYHPSVVPAPSSHSVSFISLGQKPDLSPPPIQPESFFNILAGISGITLMVYFLFPFQGIWFWQNFSSSQTLLYDYIGPASLVIIIFALFHLRFFVKTLVILFIALGYFLIAGFIGSPMLSSLRPQYNLVFLDRCLIFIALPIVIFWRVKFFKSIFALILLGMILTAHLGILVWQVGVQGLLPIKQVEIVDLIFWGFIMVLPIFAISAFFRRDSSGLSWFWAILLVLIGCLFFGNFHIAYWEGTLNSGLLYQTYPFFVFCLIFVLCCGQFMGWLESKLFSREKPYLRHLDNIKA